MLTIWKYDIPGVDFFTLALPKGAKPLCVQTQGFSPKLWVLLNPDAADEDRGFRLAGTGHPIEEGLAYIGTFQVANDGLVFHLFEVPEELTKEEPMTSERTGR